MKIKCTNCGKVVSRSKKLLERDIKKLGIDRDDYMEIYLCSKCRTKLLESDCLDWPSISRISKLSEQFIEKYKNKVNWDSISCSQKLSEQFIEKYKDIVDWDYISYRQKLSEPFIEKHKDKVDWDYISGYQELSEQFIEKYKNKVNWYRISRYQKLSPEFVQKHIDKITEDIFDNPCYKDYPDSLKLLLKQKFNK